MEDRWFWVGENLQANLAAVFLGTHAAEAMEITWSESCVHHAPERSGSDGSVLSETTKLYIPHTRTVLDGYHQQVILEELRALTVQQGISPNWYEWQFMRVDARVACLRASEGVCFGFGRPHPTKPGFKTHQDFAGPLRDYRPGMADIPDEWKGFEPVFMKVEPASTSKNVYYLKIYPLWENCEVTLIVQENPNDVPETLRQYEFGRKSKKVQKRF